MMLMEQARMPEQAVSNAFAALNGEYAWRRADLATAARVIVDEQLAIVGGEVWVVEGSLFSSLSPRKDGGWAVIAWDAPAREAGESWEHYAHRSFEATLQTIRSLRVEASLAPEVADKIYYHLSVADEPGYSAFKLSA